MPITVACPVLKFDTYQLQAHFEPNLVEVTFIEKTRHQNNNLP